jgi:hypothetical protein
MANGPLYLTLLAGQVEAVPVPKPVMDTFVSAQVTEAATGQSGFELTFTLANDSPLQALILVGNSPVPLLRVILAATWGGLPQVLIDGVIEHTEVHPSATGGSARLVVKGSDLTAVMKHVDRSGVPLPAASPDNLAAGILAQYAFLGITPQIIPVPIPDVPVPTARIPIQRGSDFNYLNELAKYVGYVFYLVPGPVPGTSRAYFGPEIRIGLPQPALTVNMDSWTNVESLSFTYQPQGAVAPVASIAAPASGPVPVVIPPVAPFSPPLGAVVPSPQDFPKLDDIANKTPAEALMRGMAEVVKRGDVVTGNGTLTIDRYGTILRARSLVGVGGAGLAFDGFYYVDSVTHDIKPGEYKQSFTLKRNALVTSLPLVPTAPY